MSFELALLASNNVTRHFGAFSNTMRIYVTEGKTIIKCASIQFKRLVAVREPAKPRFRLLSRRSPRSAQEKKCFSCLCAISEAIARCYSYSYRIIGWRRKTMYYPDDQYMINSAHNYYYYHPNEPKVVQQQQREREQHRPPSSRQYHHHHVPFAQRIMCENNPRVARVHSFTTRVYINHGHDPYVQRYPQISRSRPPSFAHRYVSPFWF